MAADIEGPGWADCSYGNDTGNGGVGTDEETEDYPAYGGNIGS